MKYRTDAVLDVEKEMIEQTLNIVFSVWLGECTKADRE